MKTGRLNYSLQAVLSAVFFYCAFPAAVLGAQVDLAPIPDDVVQKLVPKTSAVLAHPLPDKLQSHLEEALALLQQMEEETQFSLLQAQSTKAMLLGGKIQELNTLRPEINVLFSDLGPKLLPAASPEKLKAWDDLRLKVEDRLDEILLLLQNILKSQATVGYGAVLSKGKAAIASLLQKAKGEDLR